MRNGHTRRNALRARPKYLFSAPYQNLSLANHAIVVAAFNACQGMAIGFRFKDWGDYQATAEPITTIVSHVRSGTTISASSVDNSFNDSLAGFVASGFVVGDRIRTTVTGNTTLTYTILSVTTAKIIVDLPVVTQIAGASFSITTLTASVQLRKTSWFGTQSTNRNIVKPVAGTVIMYANTVVKAGTTDTTTGLFTPASPWVAGDVVTATFEFDVPVTFASDRLVFDYNNFQALSSDIDLEEDFTA